MARSEKAASEAVPDVPFWKRPQVLVTGGVATYVGVLGLAGKWGTYTLLGRPSAAYPLKGSLLTILASLEGDGVAFLIDTIAFLFGRFVSHPLQMLAAAALFAGAGFLAWRHGRRTYALLAVTGVLFVISSWLFIAPWFYFENVLTEPVIDPALMRIPAVFVTGDALRRARLCAAASDKTLYPSPVNLDCRSERPGDFLDRLATSYAAHTGLTVLAAVIVTVLWRGTPRGQHLRNSVHAARWSGVTLVALMLIWASYVHSKALKETRVKMKMSDDGISFVFYLQAPDGSISAYNPYFEEFTNVNRTPEGTTEADIVSARVNTLLLRGVTPPPPPRKL
ncbi:MAG TPA: hypothetical protein VNA69_11335 [Thermoanaerobaculia bacterium]|nr:hypothetical protein [Thermoanaerobaculia bacterium]